MFITDIIKDAPEEFFDSSPDPIPEDRTQGEIFSDCLQKAAGQSQQVGRLLWLGLRWKEQMTMPI
jgi:hypothetical protein